MGELKRLEQVSHHRGQFGEWVVYGFKYRNEEGQIAWHTMSHPNENPVHDFWVVEGKFHAVSIHYAYKMTNETRIETYGIIDVSPDEKKAILDAIAKWEQEDAEGLRT